MTDRPDFNSESFRRSIRLRNCTLEVYRFHGTRGRIDKICILRHKSCFFFLGQDQPNNVF